jgi:chorismate mutase/prephenate dehydratase
MNLDEWRSRINNLDDQILTLLNQRAEAALKIGDLKRQDGAPVYVPERETQIIRRLSEANPGPLTDAMVRAIWREILSGCRALEAPVTIAFLAPFGTFTHQAALARFGESAVYRPARSMPRSSTTSSAGRPRTAWCRSRTAPKVLSTSRSTASSTRTW